MVNFGPLRRGSKRGEKGVPKGVPKRAQNRVCKSVQKRGKNVQKRQATMWHFWHVLTLHVTTLHKHVFSKMAILVKTGNYVSKSGKKPCFLITFCMVRSTKYHGCVAMTHRVHPKPRGLGNRDQLGPRYAIPKRSEKGRKTVFKRGTQNGRFWTP